MENFKAVLRSKKQGSTKSLINKGMVPGIIYGKNSDRTQIAFEEKILHKLIIKSTFNINESFVVYQIYKLSS